jgi:hypothetical protein
LEVPVFWALLESVNGVEAQPARVDAAVINNVAPRIRAAFAFCAIGIPNSRIRTTTLNATEPLEVKSVHRRRAARHDPLLPVTDDCFRATRNWNSTIAATIPMSRSTRTAPEPSHNENGLPESSLRSHRG